MQVAIIYDDFYEVGETLFKSDAKLQALCKDFGIDDMDEVAVDTWPSALPFSPCNCLHHYRPLPKYSQAFTMKCWHKLACACVQARHSIEVLRRLVWHNT